MSYNYLLKPYPGFIESLDKYIDRLGKIQLIKIPTNVISFSWKEIYNIYSTSDTILSFLY